MGIGGTSLGDYVEKLLEDRDIHALLYFGSHTLAVSSATVDLDFPGLLLCSTANSEELMVDLDALVGVKALPIPGRGSVAFDD